MSKRPARKRYPTPPKTERITTVNNQPFTIREYTTLHLKAKDESTGLRLLVGMFIRLVTVLVGRKVLNAPDFYYVTCGQWIKEIEFSDWTPEQELEAGLQNGVILDR